MLKKSGFLCNGELLQKMQEFRLSKYFGYLDRFPVKISFSRLHENVPGPFFTGSGVLSQFRPELSQYRGFSRKKEAVRVNGTEAPDGTRRIERKVKA